MKYENAKNQVTNPQVLYIEVMGKSMATGSVLASYSTRMPVLEAYPNVMYRFKAQPIEGVKIVVFDFAPFFSREHYEWIARTWFADWRSGSTINDDF
jgi:hypothetical protein